MSVNRWHRIVLAGILCLGCFLRLYQLGSIPVGLHGDEASIGYNAYSFLKTGKDQDGHAWPLAIDQFGDYRPAGYHYLDVPFVAVFGLTALAVRLPSALFGVATIGLVYLLVLEFFNRKNLALLTAGIIAISPWHVNISRATSEGVIAAFFVILGVFLLIKGAHETKHRMRDFSLAIGFFLVSFLFYHSARIFVPTFFPLIALWIVYRTKSTLRDKLVLLGGFAVILAALVFLLTTGKGSYRPLGVSIFSIPGVSTLATQQTGEDGAQPVFVSRFFHNKFFNYLRVFLSSYFSHFSGDFFFVNTGNPIRYRVPWSSNLYLADLPLLIFGFAILLVDGVRNKKYVYLLPIGWLLLAAIPGGLTYEDLPNIQRTSLMIPALVIMIAFGAVEWYQILPNGKIKTIIIVCFCLVFAHNVTSFLHNYFYHLKSDEPWHRSASVPDLLFSLSTLSKGYKYVIMTSQGNNNFIHYLFYHRVDPAYYQSVGSPHEHENLRFENVIYKGNPCPLGGDSSGAVTDDPNVLYVNQYDCKIPINAEVVKTVNHPDGLGAYRILKVHPLPPGTLPRAAQ